MPRLPTPEPIRGRTGKLTWRVRSTDPITGIRTCRTFTNHDLATAYVASLLGTLAPTSAPTSAPTPAPTPHTRLFPLVKDLQTGKSFKDLVDKYVEIHIPELSSLKDQKTVEGRIYKHLVPYFGDMDLVDITADEIAVFSNKHLKKKKKVSTALRRKILILLGSMLRLAEESAWIAKVPRIKKPKLQKKGFQYIHTQEEIRQLLLTASHWTGRGWDDTGKATGPRVMFGKMLETLYATAVYAGLRKGELAGLKWENINLAPGSDGRVLNVTNSYLDPKLKSYKMRHVMIGDKLYPLLKRWHDLAGKPTRGHVFTNERGRSFGEQASVFKETFHEALEKAGIPRLRFHDLRHTFASHWVINGGDIFRLQQLLGHSDVKVTMVYAHLAPNHFRSDWAKM